jgi:hypothetical protein
MHRKHKSPFTQRPAYGSYERIVMSFVIVHGVSIVKLGNSFRPKKGLALAYPTQHPALSKSNCQSPNVRVYRLTAIQLTQESVAFRADFRGSYFVQRLDGAATSTGVRSSSMHPTTEGA